MGTLWGYVLMKQKGYKVKLRGLPIGCVTYKVWPTQRGWWFHPFYQRKPSRKLWPTPAEAVRVKGAEFEVIE